MTDIKVTQADRVAAAATLKRAGVFSTSVYAELAEAFARYRIEAQRPLLEALEEAKNVILNHGEDAMALMSALVMVDAAIEQAKGE